MESESLTLSDGDWTEWAEACHREWLKTREPEVLEEPLRYAEYQNYTQNQEDGSVPLFSIVAHFYLQSAWWYSDPGVIANFDRAVKLAVAILRSCESQWSEFTQACLLDLGEMYLYRSLRQLSDDDAFEKAFALLNASITTSSAAKNGPPKALECLDRLLDNFPDKVLRYISDLNRAVTKEVVIMFGYSASIKRDVSWIVELSDAYHRGFDRNGSVLSLRKAILRLTQFVSVATNDEIDRDKTKANMARMQCILWMKTQEENDLTAAITSVDESLRTAMKNSRHHNTALLSLGIIAVAWYRQSKDVSEREFILSQCKLAVSHASADGVTTAWFKTLARVLKLKYLQERSLDSLTEAIAYARQAFKDYARRMLSADPDVPIVLLDESVTRRDTEVSESLLRDSTLEIPFQLGDLLFDLYLHSGDVFVLKEAAIYAELAATTSGRLNSAYSDMELLLEILVCLYQRTHVIAYLFKAKSCAESSLSKVVLPDARAALLDIKGDILMHEFHHSYNLDLVDQAIKLFREGLAMKESTENKAKAFSLQGLARALMARDDAKIDENMRLGVFDDLEEALAALNSAIESLDKSNPRNMLEGSVAYLQRGSLYLTRHSRSRAPQDRDRAIADLRESLKRGTESAIDRYTVQNSLAVALADSHDAVEKQEAENLWRNILDAPEVPQMTRLYAQTHLTSFYASQQNWAQAIPVIQQALETLLAVRGTFRTTEDLQAWARGISGLSSAVCAITLEAGLGAWAAVESLELTRGAVNGFLIDEHEDLTELRAAYPETADRFIALQRILHHSPTVNPTSRRRPEAQISFIKEYDTALLEMKNLILSIRTFPGFKQFLRGPGQDEVSQLISSTGYIVIINMAESRSDAIIISSSEIQNLALPLLQLNNAKEWLLKDLTEYERPEYGKKNLQFREFLVWLWNSCVHDIVAHITRAHNRASSTCTSLPRVWWIGIGLCTYFPFHGAGYHHDAVSTDNTISHVISSYIPSLRSLKKAKYQELRRRRHYSNHTPTTCMTIVQMLTTPGKNDLGGVAKEEQAIRRHAPENLQINTLLQPSASEVLRALEDADMVHFGCHGLSNDKAFGLRSSLIFQKPNLNLNSSSDTNRYIQDKLYVSQIHAADLTHANLAYLSACSTAFTWDSGLADEALHPVSSFIIAGFPHAVGSLWETQDAVCVSMAEEFYREYFSHQARPGEPGAEVEAEAEADVAMALHRAMTRNRNMKPRVPLGWAAFVHYGC